MFEKCRPSKSKRCSFSTAKIHPKCEKNPLPEHLKLTDMIQCQVEVPENLRQFLHHLVYGPNKMQAEDHQERIQQLIKYISEDIAFAASSWEKTIQVTNFRVGNEKVRRFQKGYCDFEPIRTHCYHTIKELGTELTFKATESSNCTLTVMGLDLVQATGVPFDNFDRFLETFTDKDTFYDTVGIAYQPSIQQLHSCFICTGTSSADFEIGVKDKRSDQEEVHLRVQTFTKKQN